MSLTGNPEQKKMKAEQKDEDETCTRLKEALDINDLQDPQGSGAEFEVDESQLNTDGVEEDTSLRSFDKNQVYSNICVMSDAEDEEDEENLGGDGEYLTELERLQRKIKQLADSDITPDRDGGVLKQMKKQGIGSVVPQGSLVTIHYNAYTDVGQPPYDSSRLRDRDAKLRLGKGECISGLELALLSMKKQEQSRFLIRHDYAYGEMGCPPRIPPQATLIFDVELLSFVEQEGVDDYFSLTREERRTKLKYSDIDKVVKSQNSEAKEYFTNKNYQRAFGKYKKSMTALEDYHLKNDEEERLWKQQLLKVYINLAVCCQYLCHYGRTITYSNLALGLDKDNAKAHFYKGKALHSLGSYTDAEKSLKQARNLAPSSTTIATALKNLAKSIAESKVVERNMCRLMFSKPSSDSAETSTEKTHSQDTGSTSMSHTHGKNSEEAAEEPGECKPEFRAIVTTSLQNFQNDADLLEMPFPEVQMSPAEISCILDVAGSLGMGVRSRGTGSAIRHIVYKKKPGTL